MMKCYGVGDLVRMKRGGMAGKVTKVYPNGHVRVSFLWDRRNGFSQSFTVDELDAVK